MCSLSSGGAIELTCLCSATYMLGKEHLLVVKFVFAPTNPDTEFKMVLGQTIKDEEKINKYCRGGKLNFHLLAVGTPFLNHFIIYLKILD